MFALSQAQRMEADVEVVEGQTGSQPAEDAFVPIDGRRCAPGTATIIRRSRLRVGECSLARRRERDKHIAAEAERHRSRRCHGELGRRATFSPWYSHHRKKDRCTQGGGKPAAD
uniref:Uncharacterized protein n=1 Tax=Eutreptiella gymnastica TaxID=73025 RepID=A0A7S4LJ54_9EUGL